MRLGHLTAAGAAAGLALIAAPALAVTTTGATGFTATADKGNLTLAFGSMTLTCTSSSIGGPVHASGNPIAHIDSASLGGCSFLGNSATVTVNAAANPWALNANSGYTTGTTDVVNGTLTGITNVTIDINGPTGHCTFNVSGSVNGYFDEDNGKGGQELGVTSSNLTVTNVNSAFTCLGLVSNNDPATFNGIYNTNPADPKVNIQT